MFPRQLMKPLRRVRPEPPAAPAGCLAEPPGHEARIVAQRERVAAEMAALGRRPHHEGTPREEWRRRCLLALAGGPLRLVALCRATGLPQGTHYRRILAGPWFARARKDGGVFYSLTAEGRAALATLTPDSE